jgi:protein-tyrosine phosphatase
VTSQQALSGESVGRSLALRGAANARDLGGYRTADGRVVRSGAVLRSEALGRLDDGDRVAVAALGLRQVIDLRGLNEVAEHGTDVLPDGVELLQLPVYSADHDIYVALRDALAGRDAAAQAALLGNGGATRLMSEMYAWFVTDEAIRRHFSEVLRRLADPAGVPLLFHCTAGKDRTGWAAALVLSALGVPRDVVYRDYLLTNERSAATTAAIVEAFAASGAVADPALLLPLLRAEAGYLDAAFTAVESGWPDLESFLEDGLGLDDATRSRLRGNLLADD